MEHLSKNDYFFSLCCHHNRLHWSCKILPSLSQSDSIIIVFIAKRRWLITSFVWSMIWSPWMLSTNNCATFALINDITLLVHVTQRGGLAILPKNHIVRLQLKIACVKNFDGWKYWLQKGSLVGLGTMPEVCIRGTLTNCLFPQRIMVHSFIEFFALSSLSRVTTPPGTVYHIKIGGNWANRSSKNPWILHYFYLSRCFEMLPLFVWRCLWWTQSFG